MAEFLNDGTDQPPRLKIFLNLGTLTDLPADSVWPVGISGAEAMVRLKEDGFEGVQDGDPTDCAKAGIACAGSGRIDRPEDAMDLARRLRDAGHVAGTAHVGTGFESDAEMDRLAAAVIEAAEKTNFPLYIETHRATITQDVWRTLQLVRRLPEVRFNGDFSHYYTGQELPYGDWEAKLAAMEPIFERVRFMHGRIGNPSCIQVSIGDGREPLVQEHGHRAFLKDHRDLWTRAMRGFKRHAGKGDILVFAPEILSPKIYYARMFTGSGGGLMEEADRYAEALVYARIARECWEQA